MDLFPTICKAVQEKFQGEFDEDYPEISFSPVLYQAVELLSKTRIYYRCWKQVKITQKALTDPSATHPAVYGAALQLVGDYTTIGSYAVSVALVAKCVEDLFFHYQGLSEEYVQLSEKMAWRYPVYHPAPWNLKEDVSWLSDEEKGNEEEKRSKFSFCPPSFFALPSFYAVDIVVQVIEIIRLSLRVFARLFILSMSLCDAWLLCQNDPQTRFDACTELISEWDHYYTLLKQDSCFLQEQIEKGSQLADTVLAHMETHYTCRKVLAELGESLKEIAEDIPIDKEKGLEILYEAGRATLDTVYVSGKVVAPRVDLSIGAPYTPKIPKTRFVNI